MMTKITRRGLAIGFAAVALQSFLGGFPAAADSTRGVVYATIVRPLGLTNTSGMNFGTVLPNDSGGIMSIFPNGDITALGVTVSDKTEVKPGEFKIVGTHNQAYFITFPQAATLASGAGTISVVTFMHDAGGTPTLDDDGNGLFKIGATLRIGARTVAGIYDGGVDVIISNQ